MTEIISVNEFVKNPKEFNGQRVVTFKDIDKLHGRVEGTAARNFRKNKNHFIENLDYFAFKYSKDEPDEFRRFGIASHNGGYLITETGYLMLVKSFTDNLAWVVQRELVNNYFTKHHYINPQLPQTHHEEAQQMFDFVNNAGRQKPIKQLKKQVVDVLENPDILSKIDKLHEDLTCMKVLLNSCKMYISEEQYNSKMEAIQDVIGIILKDHGMLTELKPNLIQKVY